MALNCWSTLMVVAQSYRKKKVTKCTFCIKQLRNRATAASVGRAFEKEGKLLERKVTENFWLNWLLQQVYEDIKLIWLLPISSLKNHLVPTQSISLESTAGLKANSVIWLFVFAFFFSIACKVFDWLNEQAGSLALGTLGIGSSVSDILFKQAVKHGLRTQRHDHIVSQHVSNSKETVSNCNFRK